MMKKFFLLIIFLAFISFSWGNENRKSKSPEIVFKEANEWYKKGDYNKAITYYESIIAKGFNNDALHYNLANAYYKVQNYPKATLHYEKAKKLNPESEDIAFNLQLVNLKKVDKVEEQEPFWLLEFYNSIPLLLSKDGWAWLSVSFMLGAFLLGCLYLFASNISIKRSGFVLGIVMLVSSFISFRLGKLNENYHNQPYAIITSSIIYIKNEPIESSSDAFYLHGGTKVKIEDEQEEWLNISLPDGKKGWAKKGELERI